MQIGRAGGKGGQDQGLLHFLLQDFRGFTSVAKDSLGCDVKSLHCCKSLASLFSYAAFIERAVGSVAGLPSLGGGVLVFGQSGPVNHCPFN